MQMLKCYFPLPPELECERCLARLQSELADVRGVFSASINSAATLHITYEAGQQTPTNLEGEARRIGATIAARTDHRILRLEGLHCPDCAATIEKDIRRQSGVLWTEIRFASAQMAVEYEREQIALDEVCRLIGKHGVRACPIYRYAEIPEQSPSATSWRGRLALHHTSAETVLASLLTLLAILSASITSPMAPTVLYMAAIVISGRGIARLAWHAVRARAIDMNVLVLAAVLGAVGLQDWFEGATVVLLFNIGNLLQTGAMERTRRSLRTLIELGPQTVRVLRNGEETQAPVEQIEPREILRVKPGERIPMDGIIVKGNSTVDQAPITGESLPVRKQPSDQVFGGTLNGPGAIEFEVTHRFQDTMLAKIAHPPTMYIYAKQQ